MARTRAYTTDNFELSKADLQWLQAITVSVAKNALHQEQARGFSKTPLTIVDGRPNVPEEAVRFGGKIAYLDREQGVTFALAEVLMYLYRNSPLGIFKKTGRAWFRPLHYRDLHVVTLNGSEVFTSGDVLGPGGQPRIMGEFLKRLKPGDVVQIVNPMPYAKRIEVGKGIGQAARGYSQHAKKGDRRYGTVGEWSNPSSVYQRAAKFITRKTGGKRSGLWISYRMVHLSNLGYSFHYVRQFGRVDKVKQVYPSIRMVIGKGKGGSSTVSSPTIGSLKRL